LLRAEAGVVTLEFLIVFMPFFTAFCAVVQYAIIQGAGIIVMHSAVCAARSASVVLPDDPAAYGGEEVYSLSGSSASGVESPLEALVRRGALAGPVELATQSARLEAIASAALLPLIAISPLSTRFETHLQDALFQLGGARYAAQATSLELTVQHAPGSSKTFPGPSEVTARVTHLVRCNVPLVDRLLCTTAKGSRDPAFDRHHLGREGLPSGAYFRLVAQATLPLHAAGHPYAADRRGTP